MNMKKIFLFAGAVFAMMAFTACNEDLDDWAKPQSTPELSEGVENVEVTVTPEFTTSELDYDNNSGDVKIAAISAKNYSSINGGSIENLSDIKFTSLKVGNTNVPVASGDGELYANIDDINNAVTEFYQSKRHVVRQVPCEVTAVAMTKDGTAIPVSFINESDNFNLPFLPPELPAIAYESTYYYIGGYNGWNLGSPTKMDDNGDGTFSCTISIGESEWFCFAPQSAVDAQNWDGLLRAQANGDTSQSGFFNFDSTSGFSFNSEISGTIKFTISPQDWTYSYAKSSSFYFVTGSPNGWTSDKLSAFYSSDDGTTFEYTTNWTGAWDLKAWALDDVGNWDNAIGTVEDGDGSESGNLIAAGANAFQSPAAGLYTLHCNFSAMTYYWEPYSGTVNSYENISLSGDLNGWSDTDMTVNQDGHNWYALGIEISGGLKFKANHDWAVNWGCDMSVPGFGRGTQDGPNINVPEGTYNVYFNDITGQCVLIAI